MNMDLPDGYNEKKDIFRVPDGYFDHLPGRVMERVRKEGVSGSTAVVPLRQRVSRLLVAAAAVVLLFIVSYSLLRRERNVPDNKAGNGVTAYVWSGDVDEQTLYEFLEREDILPEACPASDEDAVIDYLVSEGVDESLLAELY